MKRNAGRLKEYGGSVLKKSGKIALCTAIYAAAIAAMSVLFVWAGQNRSEAVPAPEDIPGYTAVASEEGGRYASTEGWTLAEQNGERIYTAPDGDVRFVVKRATAYQKDLAAYAHANVRSVQDENTEIFTPLSVGEIGDRETYIFAYADLGLSPTQYRQVYLFNIGRHTYGAMGVAKSPEALEDAGFDKIVAGFQFK